MASYTREEFIEKYNKKLGVDTPVRPATTSAKSAFMQEYKEKYEAKYPTTEKGQTYSAPVVVQPRVATPEEIAQRQNYEQMQGLFGKEKTQEEKMRGYLNPEYKMTKEDIAEAKKYVKQLKKEFNAGTYKNDADAMKKYDLMVNLDNKTSLRGQIAQGVSGSFQPVYDIVADVALPEESKENYEKTVQQQTTAQQVQNPLAYGAGYMAGKTGQYYVAGKMLGPAVAGISKGKISGTVAGFLGDMAADVALDTIPEAIRNKHLGKTSEEIATEAVKNVAVNIAFNVGSEALIQGFKMLKNMRNSVPKETAEAMVKAVDKFDDVEKAAIAKECGFDSVKEFTESVFALPAKGEATRPTLYYDTEKGLVNDISNPAEIEYFYNTHTLDNAPSNQKIINDVLVQADRTGQSAVEIAEQNFAQAEAEVNNYLQQTIEEYKAFMGEGVAFVPNNDGYGAPTFSRQSNNPQWYRELYAKYGKAPTQEQKAAAAESAFWADVERGGGEFVPPETAAKYKAFKGLADEIKKLPVNSKAVTDEYAFSAQKGIKPIYSPVGGKQVMVNVDENNIFNLTDSEISRYMQTGKKGSTKSEKAKMAENGNNPIIANQEEFSAFIEDSIEGKRKQEIKTYGTVLDRLIKDVYIVSKGKVDLSGKFMEISSDDVKHSYDGHSQPKEPGDIALSKDDYAKIAEYIRDYDDIIYVAKDKTGLKIQLGKKINGYSVITEIISNERNSVRFKNMWGVSTRKYTNNPKYKSRAVANRATTQQKPAVSKFPSGDVNSTIYNIAQDAQVGNGNKMLENNGNNLPDSIGAMKSNPDSYFALANEHGTIPEGENPYRIVDVPTKSADGKTVSHFARTAMEAEATTNKFIPNMEELIAKGEMSHEVVTDKSAMQHAQHIIENNGWEDALERWNAVAKSNKAPTKNDIALGQMLYNNAVNARDTALAQELVVDLCVQATRAGQTVQAFRLLKQMTPSGKLYMLQKTVNQINADRLDRYKGNVEDITIPQNLADNLLKAKDGEAADAAFEKIEQHIADNIPATIGDKLNAWRYLSMLGNPRTHIRNVFGNAIFSPFKTAKDIIGAQLERAFMKDGVKTKAVVNRKTDKSLLDYAEKDFNANISAIKGEAKYGTNQHIQEMRKIFKMPLLEKLRKANTGALEAEDMLFLKHHYTKTLAGAMKANGITAANANTFENMQVMDALKTYATNEAQKATYRDVNVFSENVTRIKKKINEAPGVQILTEGILPFAKTPANVIARGVEYSPINLARGAFNLATGGVDFSSPESVISSFKNLVKGVKGEKYTVAEAFDQLASGLTGTGICALGALLASLGWVTGKEDDGGKEGDLEKLYGIQDYALNIGNISYTIDWAAPAAMPFFTGVELYNAMKDDDKSSTLISQIFKIADPVFEMSMLDGLNNAIEATAYSDIKAVVSFAQAGALNYAGQFIPTLSGQFARTGNRYRTQTYIDKTKSVSPTVQRFAQQQQAKIPGLNNQLTPYYDQWGRKQDNGNVVGRALQNFASPGYVSTDKSTAVDDEVMRLYKETKDSAVLPGYADKKFSLDGEYKHLTAKEYETFAKVKGQTSYKIIEELLNNPHYKVLDSDEQADAIAKAYSYAQAKAKEEVSDYELSKQEKLIDKNPVYGVMGATAFKTEADKDKNGSIKTEEAVAYLDSRNFTVAQKALLFECMCPTVKNNPYK